MNLCIDCTYYTRWPPGTKRGIRDAEHTCWREDVGINLITGKRTSRPTERICSDERENVFLCGEVGRFWEHHTRDFEYERDENAVYT